MEPARKKQCDISKLKFKKVKTNCQTYMPLPNAGGGGSYGSEGELYKEVFDKLEQDKKQQQQSTNIQQQEIKKEDEQEKQQAAETQAIKKTMMGNIKNKIKDIRSSVPSTWKLWLCLFVALAYDTADIIISIVTLFASEAGEWAADIPMQMFFSFMLGKHYKKIALLEFIPFLDVLPWYTVSVIMTWRSVKKESGEIGELKKEQKELGGTGGPAPKGLIAKFESMSKPSKIALGITALIAAAWLFFSGGVQYLIIGACLLGFFALILMLFNPDTRPVAVVILVLVLLLGVIGGGVIFFLAPLGSDLEGPLGDTLSSAAAIPKKLGNWWDKNNPLDKAKSYYKKRLAIATGDYYTGKVDENAQAKLGVYLEDIKQADPTFYEHRDVILFATLIVQTLDEEMNVDLYCQSDEQKEGVTPQIFPQESFVVDLYEEREIDCKFKPGDLNKGPQTVKLGAKFNFKTMSYVKSYFMDLERLRSMRREEIDPLDQYGITDKTPVATYTVGPVGIGMSVGKPPIGLDLEAQQTTMTLGITIENKWDGIVTQVNRMVIILPTGFDLIDIGANYSQVLCVDLPENESLLCSDDENNIYVVTTDEIPKIHKDNYKSYRAYMRVNKENYDKILGLSPVSTKYFKVTVDYTYNLEKEKVIDVKARDRTTLGQMLDDDEVYDVSPPIINSFSASLQPDGTVLVKWETDEPSNDIFEYFETSRPFAVNPTPNEVTFNTTHSRNLGNIGSTTGYSYRLITEDQNGNRDDKTGVLTITGG